MEKMEQENKNIKTKETTSIPFFVHEGILARFERINKRLWITVIMLIVLLVGTNAGWIYYESLYEEVVVTQEAETDSGSIHLNGTGNGNIYDIDGYDAEEVRDE